MADLHHGLFSYSTGPTPRDLRPTSHSSPTASKTGPSQLAKFETLSIIFRDTIKGSSISSKQEHDEPSWAISPSRARDAALPCLSFSPVHALALGLEPFEEEPLKAIVFGNISSENYIDLFWDIVQKQNEAVSRRLVVYEAEQSSEPRFLVCFQGQLFELRYIRCDVLVREHPRVTNASDDFLQDLENEIPQTVQDVVKMIKRGSDIRNSLDQYPFLRTAYSYIKRWVAIRGIPRSLPDNAIFKILQEYHKSNPKLIKASEDGDSSVSALLITFFQNYASKIDPLLTSLCPGGSESFSTKNWEAMLEEQDNLPLCKKHYYESAIQVMVTYTGVSQIKGAEWILMVQRKLPKLEERIISSMKNTSSTQGAQAYDPISSRFHLWPQRLISSNATAQDQIYEGTFILFINVIQPLPQHMSQFIHEALDAWKQQVLDDRATIKDHCFIRLSIDASTSLPSLKICSRKWPRVVLTGENVVDSSRDEGPFEKPRSKVVNSQISQLSGDKAARFRTAAEVLNRLKHDSSYNLDDFVIGYNDRLRGCILEKGAASWDRETTSEEFIPEHRIERFTNYGSGKGEVIWSKSERIDKIFR